MNTLEYVKKAREEIQSGVTVERFIELRYNVMAKACPHEPFSTEVSGTDFFENAYNHIMGIVPLPTEKDRILTVYDRNYINWIKQAQAEK